MRVTRRCCCCCCLDAYLISNRRERGEAGHCGRWIIKTNPRHTDNRANRPIHPCIIELQSSYNFHCRVHRINEIGSLHNATIDCFFFCVYFLVTMVNGPWLLWAMPYDTMTVAYICRYVWGKRKYYDVYK